MYDPLTRLPNRHMIQDRLEQVLIQSRRGNQKGAVLFIGLDNFKRVNDLHGHEEGDALLRRIAARLGASAPVGSTVGRFGGDEYVVILTKLSRRAGKAASKADRVGEQILELLRHPDTPSGTEHPVTGSIGITLFDGRGDSVGDVLKRAEFAMDQAKAAGRNVQRHFDPEMQAIVSARSELEIEVRQGLQGQEFLPYFQPQVDAAGRLTGAEVLARWQHPRRGLVPPGDFIPVAEKSGLILPLGRCMLEAACARLADWAGRPDTAGLSLAVNISAREFHHHGFVGQVLEVLEASGADPCRLKLELTESLLLGDVDQTIDRMTALKDEGVSFSLDDFGTGYSSLYYLKRLPLDQLKIDQQFVQDMLTEHQDAVIVRTIVGLAKSLDLEVIAEGVDTHAIRDCLAGQGCVAYQGNLFSRPLPIEEFEEWRSRAPRR
ncbi:putative bifunctional diguanylate cyclase/phosphodiesterase [Halomonas sp. C05BenzN]|uniref:putative bifunctional diguanylate cyclase/phosphodiesterase n=1 Tax=Halomonas sp. C05BenzN TaxID=3411041 RepID=UPI003B9379D5